ncbi:NAD-dependent epimerase/dehydratase family protein [Sulfitobacter sp. D35]|uniref:NAD-dependent epimerase/dehydratase family protein n=1 Tax=Sulfitobacter sp. D35 TaxID=3083252 RepID=UPI00296EE0EF|nr:NAD-dependent epimerase/dehydratase family protein [Sulfitobacter sp. D35]MDW4497886.1 NAD-dependent epimerase/dehydratase family protein [Sulfitobacter sp. D35]
MSARHELHDRIPEIFRVEGTIPDFLRAARKSRIPKRPWKTGTAGSLFCGFRRCRHSTAAPDTGGVQGERMRIAITGATGFVGAAAARCAVERGHALVRILRPGSPHHGPADVTADLADTDLLSEIAREVDTVIHCAASENPAFLALSKAASEALIRGLPKGGRFAMQGGSMVFGDTGYEPLASPQFRPPELLEDRAEFEREILNAARADISTRIVYGSFIYGGEGAAIPAAIIHAAMEREAALFFGRGDQVWSSAHVSDFGALLVDAVEHEMRENVCLFAAGRAIQMKPVADILGQVLGVPSRPVCSEAEARLFGPFAGALTINQHFSSETARERFRWCPEISDDGAAIVRGLTRQASRTML